MNKTETMKRLILKWSHYYSKMFGVIDKYDVYWKNDEGKFILAATAEIAQKYEPVIRFMIPMSTSLTKLILREIDVRKWPGTNKDASLQ